MSVRILRGDCRDVLRTLPDESVHCVVTSPPYWGLRDYGVAGQIGLEENFRDYIDTMGELFRQIWRVLRNDGTVWLNLGDSYAGGGHGGRGSFESERNWRQGNPEKNKGVSNRDGLGRVSGLKPKDLCGIPWRVAFALQADGWVLRQEIVWAKPNPMPESVTDRCTKAHEQIFLFAKAKWSGLDNGRFAHISDQDARWLAALIDAEGCIVVKRCQHAGRADTFAPQVSFGSTSFALISEFARIAGHGNPLERPGKNAPMFYWQLANNVARDFLHRIYPWLIVKKRQARIGIFVDDLTYFRGGKKSERKQRTEAEHAQLVSLWNRNKQCNRFGNPDLSDIPEPVYGKWADCERYYYDAAAIEEPVTGNAHGRGNGLNPKCAEPGSGIKQNSSFSSAINGLGTSRSGNKERKSATERGCPVDGVASGVPWEGTHRNKRSVWEIATAPFAEAHFATFPPALIEPCIKAGTSSYGCCETCGSPWEREIERGESSWQARKAVGHPTSGYHAVDGAVASRDTPMPREGKKNDGGLGWVAPKKTIGWRSTCGCLGHRITPCRVLDPFGGAGTTGLVADRLGRNAILIELNPEYATMAERRIKGDAPLFVDCSSPEQQQAWDEMWSRPFDHPERL